MQTKSYFLYFSLKKINFPFKSQWDDDVKMPIKTQKMWPTCRAVRGKEVYTDKINVPASLSNTSLRQNIL